MFPTDFYFILIIIDSLISWNRAQDWWVYSDSFHWVLKMFLKRTKICPPDDDKTFSRRLRYVNLRNSILEIMYAYEFHWWSEGKLRPKIGLSLGLQSFVIKCSMNCKYELKLIRFRCYLSTRIQKVNQLLRMPKFIS